MSRDCCTRDQAWIAGQLIYYATINITQDISPQLSSSLPPPPPPRCLTGLQIDGASGLGGDSRTRGASAQAIPYRRSTWCRPPARPELSCQKRGCQGRSRRGGGGGGMRAGVGGERAASVADFCVMLVVHNIDSSVSIVR